jgi:hypothetical protein
VIAVPGKLVLKFGFKAWKNVEALIDVDDFFIRL